MALHHHRRRLARLEQRHPPVPAVPTMAAILDTGERIGFLNGRWVPWEQPLPPACKVYGFDPRSATETQP